MSVNEIAVTPRRPSSSIFGPWSLMGWVTCLVLLASDSWLLSPCLFTLLVAWHVFRREEGPAVVLAAFGYQWLQVSIALFYLALTGRKFWELDYSGNYGPMVLIGLGAIAAYFGGYYITSRDRRRSSKVASTSAPFPLSVISISYVVAIVVSFTLLRIAWKFPQVTQVLFLLSYVRYVLLFVLMTRLMRPKPEWYLVLLVLGVEVVLGFSGYFATFRESLVFVALAIGAAATPRRASTWVAGAAVGILAFAAAVTWTAIKPIIRKEYSETASTAERLTSVAAAIVPAIEKAEWGRQTDRLVARMWMIYYPSLAYARVPSVVPHEGGKLLKSSITNTIMPRMFFPDKGLLASESDKVRKYSGVWVAGRERGTSFAFGYSAESFVDFGLPFMFVPIFIFGCLLGLCDRLMRNLLRNTDLRNGVRVVVLWSVMYLFEQSWAIMLGMTVGLMLLLVGGGVVFERALHLSEENGVRLRRRVRPGRPPEQPSRKRLSISGRIQPD